MLLRRLILLAGGQKSSGCALLRLRSNRSGTRPPIVGRRMQKCMSTYIKSVLWQLRESKCFYGSARQRELDKSWSGAGSFC